MFTFYEIFAALAGITLVTYSLINWADIIVHGFPEDTIEQERLAKERAAYLKLYKVEPPR